MPTWHGSDIYYYILYLHCRTDYEVWILIWSSQPYIAGIHNPVIDLSSSPAVHLPSPFQPYSFPHSYASHCIALHVNSASAVPTARFLPFYMLTLPQDLMFNQYSPAQGNVLDIWSHRVLAGRWKAFICPDFGERRFWLAVLSNAVHEKMCRVRMCQTSVTIESRSCVTILQMYLLSTKWITGSLDHLLLWRYILNWNWSISGSFQLGRGSSTWLSYCIHCCNGGDTEWEPAGKQRYVRVIL